MQTVTSAGLEGTMTVSVLDREMFTEAEAARLLTIPQATLNYSARIRHGGRLPVRGPSIDPGKLEVARELFTRGDLPAKRIAEIFDISRASLYRALTPAGRRTMAS